MRVAMDIQKQLYLLYVLPILICYLMEEYSEDGVEEYSLSTTLSQPYEIVSLDRIVQDLNSALQEVNILVCMPKGWCLLLLKQFKWDQQMLREMYFNEMQYYQDQIGFKNSLLQVEECEETEGTCRVCCCDGLMTVQNVCGHCFCQQCWVSWIQNNSSEGTPFMRCMDLFCEVPLLMQLIESILTQTGQAALLKQWRKTMCEQMIRQNKNHQFCTGLGCDNCIKIYQGDIGTVKCECGQQFCFRCHSDDHYPLTCQQHQEWTELVKDLQHQYLVETVQKATPNWISQNTKKCPECRIQINKEEGCNSIMCICGCNFCYKCEGVWWNGHTGHNSCPFQEKLQEIKAMEQSLFYQFKQPGFYNDPYVERFIFNQGVANSYKNSNAEAKRRYLLKFLSISVEQSEFIIIANQTVIDCCLKLKWIYAFMFFTDLTSKEDILELRLAGLKGYRDKLRYLLGVTLYNLVNRIKKYQNEGGLDEDKAWKLRQEFRQLKQQIINQSSWVLIGKEKLKQEIQELVQARTEELEAQEMHNLHCLTDSDEDQQLMSKPTKKIHLN